jgi:hypothetical protein
MDLIHCSFSVAKTRASLIGVRIGNVIRTLPSSCDTRNDKRRARALRRTKMVIGTGPESSI